MFGDSFAQRAAAFENLEAHNNEIGFQRETRAASLLAEWAANKLGITEVQSYVDQTITSGMMQGGTETIVRNIVSDFRKASVEVSEHITRHQLNLFRDQATKTIR